MSSSSAASAASSSAAPISHHIVLAAFGSRVSTHEWTPLAEDRFALLEAYWAQCIAKDICPFSHIHPPTSCFCGCPGSRLTFLDSIALRPVPYVRDFYQHLFTIRAVKQDDPEFQQAVAQSLFNNRRFFTPLNTPFVDTDGKEYRDSFLWILENVLLPTTIRDVRFTDADEDEDEDNVEAECSDVVYTLFHCLFELDSVRYYPEPEQYTRRMIIAFFRAGFDFTTPGCPSLMTAAIRSSNTELIAALDKFDVPFAPDSGDALLYRIRSTVGELRGMSNSIIDNYDLGTERGLMLHCEKILWASVAEIVYHSEVLLRAFADKKEDDERRKLRLTGLLTAIHPRFSKFTTVSEGNMYAYTYMKKDVARILVPSDQQIENLMKLFEVLRTAGFDFDAKYTWTPFYGETAPPSPMTPRKFYKYYSHVIEVLDPFLHSLILEVL